MTPPATAPLTFSVLGYALRLAEPGALRLLLAVALLALLGGVALGRRRRELRRAAGALAPRVAPGAGLARPAARLALSLGGLALLTVALARPQAGRRVEVTRRTGVDLAVVLDASRSMRARDVRPDRLARAQLEIVALLDGLAGDRVAVISFAGDAFVQCPLTTDLGAARLFLRAVEPEAMPRQGTALAAALRAAKDALEAAGTGPRSRVVLVVSDGEDHEGGVATAAKELAAAGIRLFALAVGSAEGAPVPAGDAARPGRPLVDRGGAPVVSRLDGTALRMLADVGDGDVYDLVRPGHGLAAFRDALERLQRGDVEARVETAWEERYAAAALPAFLLLLAALLLREASATPLPPPAPRREGRGGGARPGQRSVLLALAIVLAAFSPFQREQDDVLAGNERLAAGDPAGARARYDAAEAAVGARAEIDFDRGDALLAEGRHAEAAEAFRRAAGAAPPALASRALQNLGSALTAAGDREGALRALEGALVADPGNDDARWNLEVLLRGRSASRDPRAGEAQQEQEKRGEGGTGPQERAQRPEARPSKGAEPRPSPPSASERRERAGGEVAPRTEPLTRQEAERLLEALRARERRAPLFGRERPQDAGRPDAAKAW